MPKFVLDYRSRVGGVSGTWGPFETRSLADAFAVQVGIRDATYSITQLRDPDSYLDVGDA